MSAVIRAIGQRAAAPAGHRRCFMQHHGAALVSETQRRHQARDTCANDMACSRAAHARLALACGMGMIPMA